MTPAVISSSESGFSRPRNLQKSLPVREQHQVPRGEVRSVQGTTSEIRSAICTSRSWRLQQSQVGSRDAGTILRKLLQPPERLCKRLQSPTESSQNGRGKRVPKKAPSPSPTLSAPAGRRDLTLVQAAELADTRVARGAELPALAPYLEIAKGGAEGCRHLIGIELIVEENPDGLSSHAEGSVTRGASVSQDKTVYGGLGQQPEL